jgi:cytochrome c
MNLEFTGKKMLALLLENLKKRIILIFFVLGCSLYFSLASFAFAIDNVAKGKTLFNDPKAFGGQRACSSCHPQGKGIENAGTKKKLMTKTGLTKTLEEAINLCIVNANKGKALDPKSEQMKAMVAYIKSFAKKMEKTKTNKKLKKKDDNEEKQQSLKPSPC